ncbi:MAG: nucleoside monophosphate kinase [Planctomycetes bacterium]|nr:nucleoside monophosphate kinase [Planctomycetota bacterium]
MMPGRYKSVLLFGAPGVGKGTQGKLLGRIPGFVHVASGEIFRALDKDSELGRQSLKYSSQGLLVPDDLTIALWRKYMQCRITEQAFRPPTDLLVLDGIPRNLNQAKILDQHIEVMRIIHLTAPNIDEMVERMKRRAVQEGRRDDADEAIIRRRFDVYDQETSPMLGYYETNLICDVSAVGSPAEVLMHVLQAVVPTYREHFGNPLG